jgi:hypothetical protein
MERVGPTLGEAERREALSGGPLGQFKGEL